METAFPQRLAVILLSGLISTGCTLLPVGGKPTGAPAAGLSPMGHGLREYRVAFHVHCYLSHDSTGTIEEIAAAARDLGLDAVILDDHYKPGNIARAPRGVEGGVLFIPGVEIRGGGGSILAFNLKTDFDNDAPVKERLAGFQRQGAISVLGHVEEIKDWDLEPFQAFEIYNLHAEFTRASKSRIAARFLFLPPDAFFEASITNSDDNLALWDRELGRGRRLAPIAGHDAHANVRLFGPLGGVIGTYPEILRLFSTHILASELTPDAITEAVRAGRTFVVFGFLGGAAGFSLSYGKEGSPPGERTILGGEARYDPDHTLEVTLPESAPRAIEVRVLKDGKPMASFPAPASITLRLPGPGIYRVEVYRGERLWIVPAPIYVLTE